MSEQDNDISISDYEIKNSPPSAFFKFHECLRGFSIFKDNHELSKWEVYYTYMHNRLDLVQDRSHPDLTFIPKPGYRNGEWVRSE